MAMVRNKLMGLILARIIFQNKPVERFLARIMMCRNKLVELFLARVMFRNKLVVRF